MQCSGRLAGLPDAGFTYRADDQITQISQGGSRVNFSADVAGRRHLQTTTTAAGTTTASMWFTDASDNPGFTITGAETQRYVELVGGNLGASITTSQHGVSTSVLVSTPRGDITTTIPLAGGLPQGLEGWDTADEHGNPTSTTTVSPWLAGGPNYGWLGTHQRATTSLGFTLMGVRLYNRGTGLFTSTDPVHGGNTTTYTYPQDPINHTDLDGQWKRWARKQMRRLESFYFDSKWGNAVQLGCWLAIRTAVGAGCAVISGVANVSRYGWKRGLRKTAIDAIIGKGAGHLGKGSYRAIRGQYHKYYHHASRTKYRIPRWYSHGNRYGRSGARFVGRSVQGSSSTAASAWYARSRNYA